MRYLDLMLPRVAENLALDEALLAEAEAAGRPTETLRFWEPAEPLVVVGRSSKVEREVHADTCRQWGVPILRRISGGAAVVAGPGCLMYALVLSRQRRGELRSADRAHEFVLGTMVAALEELEPAVQCRGISDLAIGQLKFSGNSVRLKRDHLLYHGTLLYDFPLGLIERYLAMPPRQPRYRDSREHLDFVANLEVDAAEIRSTVADAFGARDPCDDWPQELTTRLTAERYSRREWNEQF